MISQEVKNYDPKFQQFMLSVMLNEPEIFVRCQGIIKPEYFDKAYKPVVNFVLEYADKYRTLPSLKEIEVNTTAAFEAEVIKKEHRQGHLDSIESFCRHKALENAIQEGMKCVQERKYGMLEVLVKEAMQISLQNDLGTNYFEDPEGRIRALFDEQGTISTGWIDVDKRLFGGFGPGELEIFLAPSGCGKSMLMQNLAVNFSARMMNGVYISLELSENLVNSRIDSMMLDRSKKNIQSNIEDVAAEIKVLEKKRGSFYVKRMPESSTTVHDIRAYLKEYLVKTNLELHYVCVDYLDLLTSPKVGNSADTFMKDKFVAEELRALASEFNVVMISASQLNRSAIDSTEYTHANIAGGISKIYTADNVIGIRNTDATRARGEIGLEFLKTRNSGGSSQFIKCGFNVDTMRVFDHPESPNLGAATNLKYQPKSVTPSTESIQQTAQVLAGNIDMPVQTFEDSPNASALNTQNKPASSGSGIDQLRNMIKKTSRSGV
ncbi:DnaB-like DNA helicase [Xanthomonas phage XaC1]|nr:DnaB-like DNA helicase [Xanthomonas phage XaC1]